MPKGVKKEKEALKISITTEKTYEEEPTTRKRKTFEELTIQYDYLFKRIMSEKDICLRFVQIILGIKIKDIAYIKTEEVLKELYDSKGIRLDVYLKDEDGIVYNIEMQMTSLGEEEFAKRFRYYEAMIILIYLKLVTITKT
ncbi:Rpn family recombination-promoting nuclease/putative transposase [bacterium]|nr:Rpn family recombination-promoting nuclease/putative transposase [bacterium]